MATWALSASKQTVFGDQRVIQGLLTATGTYTAGGDNVTPATFGLDAIDFATLNDCLVSSTTALMTASPSIFPTLTGFKIQLFGDSGGGAGTALSEASGTITGFTILVEVKGV